MREKILLDKDWLFHKGDINKAIPTVKGPIYTAAKTERMKWGPASYHYNDSPDDFRLDVEFGSERWDRVNLPHDYIIEDAPKKQCNSALGFFDYENAWYRKHFTVNEDDKNKRICIIFDGIASIATIYLNGCLLKHNFCGYNTFEVDISDYVHFDKENILAVYVEHNGHEGWWYEGGGIYRHVWMVKTDAVAVDLWGVYVKPQRIRDNKWDVSFETTVLNESYEKVTAEIISSIKDANGEIVATAKGSTQIDEKDKAVANYSIDYNNPILWDIDNPYLYTVTTDIFVNGEHKDSYLTRFGFRYFEIDANEGFFLNGKYLKVKGVCAHQDFGLTGKAVPDNIHKHKIKLIKEMGANGYRTSHYPHTEAIMDALDEMGFIVLNETRWFESTEESKEQLEMLLKRDRNRPSVFMWSLGNEEMYHETDEGRRINKSLVAFAKKFDKFRPVTSAISHSPETSPVCEDMDIIGVNYNHWSYDNLHKKYPDKPVFSSECCATATTRGWYYDNDPNRGYTPAYDRDTNSWFTGREKLWKMVMERKWLFGAYQWIAFEHRGEAIWPRVCSQSGAIGLFLQKKDAFFQNQSHWKTEPMVHLLPHWNWDNRENELINVFAYTNCSQLELFLNGESLGRQTIEKWGHGEWQVKFSPGKLTVKAYEKEQEVASDYCETTGRPVALKLRLENSNITANGQDIALFTCYCVDDKGRLVPDASPFVSFNCNDIGRIVGTGSDVSDHNPVNCPDRKMRAGLISVAVKLKEISGALRVYAQTENLKGASIEVEIKKPDEMIFSN